MLAGSPLTPPYSGPVPCGLTPGCPGQAVARYDRQAPALAPAPAGRSPGPRCIDSVVGPPRRYFARPVARPGGRQAREQSAALVDTLPWPLGTGPAGSGQ